MRPQMLIYSFSCHNLSSSQLKGVLQLGRGKEETERERERGTDEKKNRMQATIHWAEETYGNNR